MNKEHLTCTVPVNKEHLTGTVPVNIITSQVHYKNGFFKVPLSAAPKVSEFCTEVEVNHNSV